MRELEKLEMALQAREYKKAQPSLKTLERFMESANGIIASLEVRKLFSCISDSDR